jgi:hypothetical protein
MLKNRLSNKAPFIEKILFLIIEVYLYSYVKLKDHSHNVGMLSLSIIILSLLYFQVRCNFEGIFSMSLSL